MANVREYIQIDSINAKSNVALGVSLPFNGEAVFNSTYTTKNQSKSNLINILLTQPGERIMQPDFGVGLRQLLFENTPDTESIKLQITNQVKRYLPQITITDVFVDQPLNTHVLNIVISFRVNQTNEEDAIQVNFNTAQNIPEGNNLSTQY
jgi:uncharacterized protein